MVGAGAMVFAVMGYVVANYKLDKVVGAQVKLNPIVIGAKLGEPPEEVEKAIEYLCSPDPKSTTKEEDGRRLVQVGQFDYRVVNGAKYTAIKDAEEEREKARDRKRLSRMTKPEVKAFNRTFRKRNGDGSREERQAVKDMAQPDPTGYGVGS